MSNGAKIAVGIAALLLVGGVAWVALRPASGPSPSGPDVPVPPSQRDGESTDVAAGLRLAGEVIRAGTEVYRGVREDARRNENVSQPPQQYPVKPSERPSK